MFFVYKIEVPAARMRAAGARREELGRVCVAESDAEPSIASTASDGEHRFLYVAGVDTNLLMRDAVSHREKNAAILSRELYSPRPGVCLESCL